MAWESRGNRRYYYRKRRQGQHVISEYVGQGGFIELLAKIDESDRRLREMRQAEWRKTVDTEMANVRELADVEDLMRKLTAAVLIINGYHTHKRQWRRQVGRKQQDTGKSKI
jgi:hypothetical protein